MKKAGKAPQGGTGKKKSHRVSNTILVLILLAGVAIAGYPAFSDYWNSMHQTRAIQGYAERVAELDNEEYIAVWESALDYNRRLAEDPNPWAMTDEEIDDYERQLNVDGTGNSCTLHRYNPRKARKHPLNEALSVFHHSLVVRIAEPRQVFYRPSIMQVPRQNMLG